MKLKVLGAAGTVTGSSYVLTSQSGQSILIDLGMFQGPPDIELMNYLPFDYNCAQLSAALLTHAHLDHCGRLPILFSHGFVGDIWMTPATLDLVEVSLFDSAKIGKAERGDKALYDRELVETTLQHCRTIKYRNPVLLGDFKVTFRDAGHLLGAAIIEIEDVPSTAEIKKIVFSGDLGNSPGQILEPTETVTRADAVVMESTYGDKLHPKEDPQNALLAQVNAVENSGGTLLIPTFALEKTQDLLHMFMHLKKEGKIKTETPVYLDSPMAQKATQIYKNYPNLCNKHVQADISDGSLFYFPGLEIVMTHIDSQAIHDKPGPKVIMAGGGMMTGGRILTHAAFYLPNPLHRIFFTGYQGEDTLGREILLGNKVVVIDDTSIHIKATVSSTRAMSGHADQDQLINWLQAIKGVKKVFLTHGDQEPRAILAQRITKDLGLSDITLPYHNQEISF